MATTPKLQVVISICIMHAYTAWYYIIYTPIFVTLTLITDLELTVFSIIQNCMVYVHIIEKKKLQNKRKCVHLKKKDVYISL